MRYLLGFINILLLILTLVLLPFRLAMAFVRRVFRRRQGGSHQHHEKTLEDAEIQTLEITSSDEGLISVNLDEINEDEQKAFREAAAQKLDLTPYEGEVQHAYDVTFVDSLETCPKCHAELQQHYANFIYATQIAPRVMFAPAGYFCTQCPTVIVSQKMLESGVSEKFDYQGVLGIDYDTREVPDFFQTWNGQQTAYVLDENETMMGLESIATSPHRSLHRKKQERRKKKRIVKQSKRKNRRKK